MKLVNFAVVLLWLTISVKAQTNEKESKIFYFDKDWLPTQDSTQAKYYRKIESQGKEYLVRDFYSSTRSLQMEAVCSQVTPDLIRDGLATFYYENGIIERTGVYRKNNRIGIHKSYYETNNPKSIIVYREQDELIAQYWNEQGTEILKDGTGFIIDREAEVPVHIQVMDSVRIFSYIIEQQDTVYLSTLTPADYKGGMRAFYQSLSGKLSYPKVARRQKIEGKVFIQFTVKEDGRPYNAKVIRGIGGGCDEEALNACLEQINWKPAFNNDRPVKMRMILPVVFKLN
jgi:TonB family protein